MSEWDFQGHSDLQKPLLISFQEQKKERKKKKSLPSCQERQVSLTRTGSLPSPEDSLMPSQLPYLALTSGVSSIVPGPEDNRMKHPVGKQNSKQIKNLRSGLRRAHTTLLHTGRETLTMSSILLA